MKPEFEGRNFALYNADCVEVLAGLPDESVDCAVFSSPFSALYIYSDSERDMGNAASDEQFLEHHAFMAQELYRVLKPGAVICDHVKDTVFYQNSSPTGEGGLWPFSDEAGRNYRDAGFCLRARVTVWRDPVREMTKTKHERLLYKNIHQNSRVSAMGMPEYVLVMRKDSRGVNTGDPVRHAVQKWGDERMNDEAEEIAHEQAQKMLTAGMIDMIDQRLIDDLARMAKVPLPQWQEWASPVWMSTMQTDVLNAAFKGDDREERHLCPMPLDLIERCLRLYSNPGDLVLDPFNGIGSTGYQALGMGRRYLGIELKPEYAAQAAKFLTEAEERSVSLLSEGAA